MDGRERPQRPVGVMALLGVDAAALADLDELGLSYLVVAATVGSVDLERRRGRRAVERSLIVGTDHRAYLAFVIQQHRVLERVAAVGLPLVCGGGSSWLVWWGRGDVRYGC